MIELTPAMEIPNSAGIKVIDLTEVLQAQPAKAAPERRAQSRPDQPPPSEAKPVTDIETAVDAAFDIIQAEHPIEEPPVVAPAEPVALQRQAEMADGPETLLDEPAAPSVLEPEAAPVIEQAAFEPAVADEEIEPSVVDLPAEAAADEVAEEGGPPEEMVAAPAEPQAGVEDALDSAELELSLDMDLAVEIEAPEPLPVDEPAADDAVDEVAAEAVEAPLVPDDAMVLTDKVVPIDLTDTEATPADEDIDEDQFVEVDFGMLLESEPLKSPPAAKGLDTGESIVELTEIAESPSAGTVVAEEPPADGAGEEIVLIDQIEPVELTPAQEAPVAPVPEAEAEEGDFIELIDITGSDEGQAAGQAVEAVEAEDAAEEAAFELIDIVGSEPDALETVEAPRAVAEDDDDEDIILLTDIVDPAEVAALLKARAGDLHDTFDDATIDLTDIVDPAEMAAIESGQAADALAADEAIELGDVVDPAEVAAALERSLTESEDDEDEVVELLDTVDDGEPVPGDEPAAVETGSGIADRVIRLDSILNHVSRNKDKLVENITQGVEAALVKETMTGDGEGDGMAIGKDLEDIKGPAGESSALSGEELERAVERVIRAKYGESIEQLIAKTVEKVVTREIESLKRTLLEDQNLIDD